MDSANVHTSTPERVAVETGAGTVIGRVKNGVVIHAGIPYAAPPTGDLRFAPPRPHPGWEGERDATRFGAAAPQIPSGGMTDSAPVDWDEDCLFLNVTAPLGAAGSGTLRPIVVWIHGGGYRTGQSNIPWYNGSSFATRGDIVSVSINYRLGALGFAELGHVDPALAGSGLNGIRDMVMALEWVRDKIAAFGGDPDVVTIAGESAGGFAVSTLLALPAAQGLFHRAIPQSGAAHHTMGPDRAASIGASFIDACGPEATSAAGLRSLTVDQILDAQTAVSRTFDDPRNVVGRDGGTTNAFYPVVDGTYLPAAPIDLLAGGASAGIPVMTGTNRHETTLWGYGTADADRLQTIAASVSTDPVALIAAYREADPAADDAAVIIAITTDFMFRIPAVRLAEARATGDPATEADTWVYLFEWESRAMGGKLGATHSMEIPFAFNVLDAPGVDAFIGEGPTPQHVADVMHEAWTNFIRSGHPCGGTIDAWPTYSPDRRAVLRFGDQTLVSDDPDGSTRAAWDGLR